MAGPMANLASGKRLCTASAMTCAAEWRMRWSGEYATEALSSCSTSSGMLGYPFCNNKNQDKNKKPFRPFGTKGESPTFRGSTHVVISLETPPVLPYNPRSLPAHFNGSRPQNQQDSEGLVTLCGSA